MYCEWERFCCLQLLLVHLPDPASSDLGWMHLLENRTLWKCCKVGGNLQGGLFCFKKPCYLAQGLYTPPQQPFENAERRENLCWDVSFDHEVLWVLACIYGF